MVKGFTQLTQRILTHDAQEEAKRFNSDQLLPEHIIIAMLKDWGGTACKALMYLRIDLGEFRRNLENSLPRASSLLLKGDAPMSERAKRMLENAMEEARTIGNEYLGTEHLLSAAYREENSAVQVYLNQLEVNLEVFRALVRSSFNRRGQTEAGFSVGLKYSPGQGFGINLGPRIKPASYPVLTPALDEFSRDLTALARAGKLDPVVGRKKEISAPFAYLPGAQRTTRFW